MDCGWTTCGSPLPPGQRCGRRSPPSILAASDHKRGHISAAAACPDQPTPPGLQCLLLGAHQLDRQRGADMALYQVLPRYDMNEEGVTLTEGEDKPDLYMFREAIRQVKLVRREAQIF
jgi:hypothetical protein